jgi:hypothetical protein
VFSQVKIPVGVRVCEATIAPKNILSSKITIRTGK